MKNCPMISWGSLHLSLVGYNTGTKDCSISVPSTPAKGTTTDQGRNDQTSPANHCPMKACSPYHRDFFSIRTLVHPTLVRRGMPCHLLHGLHRRKHGHRSTSSLIVKEHMGFSKLGKSALGLRLRISSMEQMRCAQPPRDSILAEIKREVSLDNAVDEVLSWVTARCSLGGDVGLT